MSNRNKLIIIALVALAVIAILVSILAANRKDDEGVETVSVASPLSRVSTTVTPYYKGDYSSGGEDAVNTQYVVFGIDDLNTPGVIKDALRYGATQYVQKYQPPNAEPVYLHLDIDSVKYKNDNDYSFNFYTDSPEAYFSYHVVPKDDSQSTTVISPVGGGW